MTNHVRRGLGPWSHGSPDPSWPLTGRIHTARQSCGAMWRAMALCHCTTCHASFATITGFDRHRRSDSCLDPATLRTRKGEPVLRAVREPYGQVWHRWANHPGAGAFEAQPPEVES
jgi:hypothetical protein